MGSWDLRNNMVVNSLGFFVSHIAGLGNGDAGNLEVPMGADPQKSPPKPVPSSQSTNKERHSKTETFYTITTLAKHNRKDCGTIPTHSSKD